MPFTIFVPVGMVRRLRIGAGSVRMMVELIGGEAYSRMKSF